METHEVVPKRGPSSPKIIVDTNLTVQNSSAIRPTPGKPGKSITHLDNKVQVSLFWGTAGQYSDLIHVKTYIDKFFLS